ncbi:Sodium channel protein 60E [Durusdinium trenchii]
MQLTRDSVWLKNEYFNGFGDTMLTLLLDAVLPDLSGFIRNLAEHGGDTGWLIATLMMFFVLLGSVTVMNMLVGVLVEVIKTVSEIEREQLEVSFVKKIFSDMITKMNLDADGDNRISKEEFDTLLSKPEAAKALMNIGVDVVGLVDYRDVLFGNEGSMELSFAEFMEAILELRGTNNAKVKDIVDLRKFVSQETGAIYELVATVTNQDDESSLASSSRSRSRSHSKHGQERYEERLSSKIAEEC